MTRDTKAKWRKYTTKDERREVSSLELEIIAMHRASMALTEKLKAIRNRANARAQRAQ